jgi:hemerythrin-like metal-binding protein
MSYADYHFRAEEHYMRDIEYKDIDKQIAEHNYFKEKALELGDKSKTTDYMLCHDIIVFLGNWLMHHVIEEDKKISLDLKRSQHKHIT